jgi:hypothetical protein
MALNSGAPSLPGKSRQSIKATVNGPSDEAAATGQLHKIESDAASRGELLVVDTVVEERGDKDMEEKGSDECDGCV